MEYIKIVLDLLMIVLAISHSFKLSMAKERLDEIYHLVWMFGFLLIALH